MRWVLIGLAVLVSGCSLTEQPEVAKCKSSLLSSLKSPATFKLVSADTVRIEERQTRYQSVDILYDAQNGFGALIRNRYFCAAPIDGDEIRDDLEITEDQNFEDALKGKGYFSPKAKLPTRSQESDRISREADRIVNESLYGNGSIAN